MTIDPLVSMAFATGFLGSGHCIGMCGGIVCALSVSGRQRPAGLAFNLLYNLGRLLIYGAIGLLVGWLGSALAYTQNFAAVTRTALVVSDLFIILVGLGTAGAFSRFNVMKLESAGPIRYLTRAVAPLIRLSPALRALPIGLLMGFLPCGFLYAMFITAAQSAAPFTGALIMLAFGAGTAPALLLFGSAAHWLSARARGWMLRGAGLMVLAMGLYNLYRHARMIDWIMAAIPYQWFCCP